MASTPDSPPSRSGSSSSEIRGPSSSRAVMSPSEPRLASRASFDVIDAQFDRPARLQMFVAGFLVLVLIVIPLYLWRRPRAESIPVNVNASESAGVAAAAAPTVLEEKVVLGDVRTVSCHDPGPKKTPPEQCDHIAELEKALTRAIEDNASCVPKDAGGGTITFLADVAFRKKTVSVTAPKDGRTLRNGKIVARCEKVVRGALGRMPFDEIKHEHARYRISVSATYPALGKP